jgi:3-hydroxymyristoyl/3-hydroxydecanoyl-(acyl carrier protein) dehydratase
MPGSLGVEAMCQLLQWYLIERGAAAGLASPRFEPIMIGQPLTWKYRGQVRPTDGQLIVELEITAEGQDDHGRYVIADGWLWVDDLRIYHVTGLGMRIASGGATP